MKIKELALLFNANGYQCDAALSAEDKKELNSEIDSFDSEKLKMVRDMAMDYYKLELSDETVVRVLKRDYLLAVEVFENSIRDTCARSLFIGVFCKMLEIPPWPCNGDSADYIRKFNEALDEACEKWKNGWRPS